MEKEKAVNIELNEERLSPIKRVNYLNTEATQTGGRVREKATFNVKINLNLKKSIVRCYVWNDYVYEGEMWTIKERKMIEELEIYGESIERQVIKQGEKWGSSKNNRRTKKVTRNYWIEKRTWARHVLKRKYFERDGRSTTN